jgi:hypothetical protein
MRKVEKVSRTEVKYLPTLHEKLKKNCLENVLKKEDSDYSILGFLGFFFLFFFFFAVVVGSF